MRRGGRKVRDFIRLRKGLLGLGGAQETMGWREDVPSSPESLTEAGEQNSNSPCSSLLAPLA